LGHAYQNVSEVLKYAPVPALVRISKGCSGNVTPKSDVVELLLMRVQAGFDIPQTFTTRQLGICQAEQLVESGKALGSVLSAIPANADVELMPREKLKQLSKDGLASVHGHPPELPERYHPESRGRIQIEKRIIVAKSLMNRVVTPVHSKLTGQ